MTRKAGSGQRGLPVSCIGVRQIYQLGDSQALALDDISFELPAGGQLAVIGPSGSGKSTLLGLLAGLARPTGGELLVGPHRLGGLSEGELLALRAGDIGVVAQNPARNLLPFATAEDNIRFAQRAALRIDREGRVPFTPAAELLAELGLADLAGRPVARMSGGEQQRLSVAVAVAAAPGLLLADEPTSQLDGVNRDRVVELLERVAHRIGSTLIVVTHDPAVATALGRALTLRAGRIVGSAGLLADDDADALLTQPRPAAVLAPPARHRGAGAVAAPVEAPDIVLAADQVSYTRGGRVVLDKVSIQVVAGEVVAVLGPSGSGKSSLLALLAGLEAPDGGSVTRNGRTVDGVGPDVGLVLQGYGLVSVLTAAENIAVALQARHRPAAEVRKRTHAALAAVGLEDIADHLVEEMSGGQQQRVALARALVATPKVLLADEMTAELDQDWKQRLLSLVFSVADRGALVVLATHDPDTAQRCNRQVHLLDGRIVAPLGTHGADSMPRTLD
jgi:putative ABC transport system ATP-binding protein